MAKYGDFLFYHLLLVFFLTTNFLCKASSDEDRKVHIVYMGSLPDDEVYSPMSHHLSILQRAIGGSSAADSLVRSYKKGFNGFAAKLTNQESKILANMKEVVSVFPDRIFHTQTTRSWDFMGLHQKSNRNLTVESDIIVGVIDTGIWPESESFNDKGFGRPPKKWKGACKGGKNFTCNNKLIGARFYSLAVPGVVNSARDDIGHGSHTASTAAGNSVEDVSFYGLAEGTARGGVPSARIAAYKTCTVNGCDGTDILAAFDDAIADGVDIITISIGGSFPDDFYNDPIAIASFHAMEKGILTVNSAGNSGPDVGTVASVAPWLFSVAASSIDRRFIDKVVLGNRKNFIGNSVNSFIINETNTPLIHGKAASVISCSDSEAGSCEDMCLDSGKVKGKIVVCDRLRGDKEAYRAGALGSIWSNDRFKDVSFVVSFPALGLLPNHYIDILSYYNSTKDSHAKILKSEVTNDSSAPIVASFSSRGPNFITPDILKPDVSAPGINILAAYSAGVAPSDDPGDKRRLMYNVVSGTSMACPHVAGVAAYVKSHHPDWSPSAIKSSIMTTAWEMRNTQDSNGDFGYGSGHVNPINALNPGLVYETSKEDYIEFLCRIGYNEGNVKAMTGDNSTCPKGSGSEKRSAKDLNYPSMTALVSAKLSFTVSFQRRVKNVGLANSTYDAKIFYNSLANIKIKVEPAVLSFKSLNEEEIFNVTVKGNGLVEGSFASAALVWTDGVHGVRSPIVVHTFVSKT